MFETVIVPLDGSAHAEFAVPYGIEEAARHEARLVLINVVPRPEPCWAAGLRGGPPPVDQVWPAVELDRERRDRLAYLDGVGRRFAVPDRTNVVVAVGDPARRVLEEAGKHPRPLIVMTTGDATVACRPPVSEVARRAMLAGNVPILAVRAPPPPAIDPALLVATSERGLHAVA